jgi:hypothetical protein
MVFEKKLYTLIDKKDHKRSVSYVIAHEPHFWDRIAIRTLTAKDFSL